jgi:glycine hydroxymethyltransferase
LGTPAATSRGMKEKDMEQIAVWIDKLIGDVENETLINSMKNEVNEYMKAFPLYE